MPYVVFSALSVGWIKTYLLKNENEISVVIYFNFSSENKAPQKDSNGIRTHGLRDFDANAISLKYEASESWSIRKCRLYSWSDEYQMRIYLIEERNVDPWKARRTKRG